MIFLENAVIWTMAGQDYANGSILIDGGKIVAVGRGVDGAGGRGAHRPARRNRHARHD